MARLAVLAACGLAMLAMVSYVNADATAFATSLSRAARDAPGCGELDAPCCLRGGKRCNDKGLACMSLETAQETKCRACGSEGLPACEGEVALRKLLACALPRESVHSVEVSVPPLASPSPCVSSLPNPSNPTCAKPLIRFTPSGINRAQLAQVVMTTFLCASWCCRAPPRQALLRHPRTPLGTTFKRTKHTWINDM